MVPSARHRGRSGGWGGGGGLLADLGRDPWERPRWWEAAFEKTHSSVCTRGWEPAAPAGPGAFAGRHHPPRFNPTAFGNHRPSWAHCTPAHTSLRFCTVLALCCAHAHRETTRAWAVGGAVEGHPLSP